MTETTLFERLDSIGASTHHSHSAREKPACLAMFEYLYLKDERKKIPVGVPAIAGGAAHDAIQSVVCDGVDVEQEIIKAQERIEAHEPINELDEIKRVQYIEDAASMVMNGVEAVQPLSECSFTSEERISMNHPKLQIEMMGFVDLTADDCIVELKTKWSPFGPPKKDGTRSPRAVKLPERPDNAHVRQVAIYWAATGKPPYLVYITAQGAVTFTPDNCEMLSAASLNQHFNQILHNAIVWENLLSISTDPHVLKYWIQPNWDDFRWRFMPDEYLQQAKELFTI